MPRDIDWNGHLNNVRYMDIIYNAVPIDILKDNLITELQIDYLKECKLNDSIDIYYHKEDESIYIKGDNEGKTAFSSKLRIKEIFKK